MIQRIIGFNTILRGLVDEFNSGDTPHYYFYTNVVFNNNFPEDHVSDLDCFHPSTDGQRALSEITWQPDDEPNFQDW